MWRIQFSSFLIPVVSAVALMLAPAMVPAADIVDGGGFFSPETLTKANQTIRDIAEKTKHEIRIETFASVSADKVDAVKKMDKTEREAFFAKWLHERTEKTNARGVFILICKEPAHLRMWGAKEIQQAGFGAEQAKTVRELLLAGFKAKEFDKTLSDALAQLAKTFDSMKAAPKKVAESTGHAAAGHGRATHPNQNGHQARPAPQAPVNRAPQPAAPNPDAKWGNIVVVIAMVLGGIFLFSAVMRMFGGGQSHGVGGYGGGYGGAGGGGGGFMSGLAGGIFGAVAGNWLYNQFSGNSASASETHGSGHGSSNFTDESSSAYNDDILDTGSSDAGGTDFGGGDFGGGDFDGGGDGGGDF